MKFLDTLVPNQAPSSGPPPRSLMAFVKWALDGSGFGLSLAAVSSIFAGIMEMGGALVLGWVIDAALTSSAETFWQENVPLVLLGLFFFFVARPFAFSVSTILNSYVVAPNIHNLVLSRLHRWSLGHSVGFYDNDFAGRIAQKEMQTARALTDAVVEIFHTALFALASMLGALVIVGQMNFTMVALLSIWVAAYLALIRYFMPKIRVKSAAKAGARANVTGQIVDTVTNIKTVKLFAHADHEDKAALRAMEKQRQATLEHSVVSIKLRLWLMCLAGVLPVVLVGSALVSWTNGATTAGQIAAAGAVSLRLSQMTGWVSFTLMALYGNIGEVENGMKTLTPPHDITDQPDAQDLHIDEAKVTFADATYAYGRESGGIQNVDMEITAGQKVGIVGASGAGKSTLVSALLRLYDLEQGRIEIDGQDISSVTQESLRHNIGMVTQETAMFNRSARDNILYGRPDATEAEVISAAKQAKAHDFIVDLQDHQGRTGYDAHLGERGVKLSGGQRQRIALARAILKNAPVLILDEATSALDSEVEAEIQAALDTVMTGKTVLAIAHRLSTIARMDRIIVLDKGQIVEDGTHTELLDLGGLYARYWNRQSGGFIGIAEAAE